MAKKKTQISKLWLLVVLILFTVAWRTYMREQKAQAETTANQELAIANSTDALQQVAIPADISSQILHYPGFTVSFNKDYHQPNWVAWELTGAEATSNLTTREQGTFMPDPNAEGCAALEDYKGSGFDRGHMCPAGDMKWSQDAMAACFYLTNMCPQDHALNSGAWGKLEDKCRQWAQRDSAIVIICGPVLTDKLPRKIGPNNVPVPERFFKVVLAPYAEPVRGIGFIMANGKVPGGMQAAAVSIDEVEDITGFDFFAALPDDIENKVESECNFPKWSQR